MVRKIIYDPILLSQKCVPATVDDEQIFIDLVETLIENAEICAGMAANMIGEKKRIIAFYNDEVLMGMNNPEIIKKEAEYETEEGCLCHPGRITHCRRYKKITVRWQASDMKMKTDRFYGYTAEIIQHEIDHCNGILI